MWNRIWQLQVPSRLELLSGRHAPTYSQPAQTYVKGRSHWTQHVQFVINMMRRWLTLFGDALWLEMYGQWWQESCRNDVQLQRISIAWCENWCLCWRQKKWRCGPSGMHETGTYLIENKPTVATFYEGQWRCYKNTRGSTNDDVHQCLFSLSTMLSLVWPTTFSHAYPCQTNTSTFCITWAWHYFFLYLYTFDSIIFLSLLLKKKKKMVVEINFWWIKPWNRQHELPNVQGPHQVHPLVSTPAHTDKI